jgi:hypothetical protein
VSAEQELQRTLEQLSDALEGLSVPWAIGGSFASTVHGEPRATNDIDVVAMLRAAHVTPFVHALGSEFYADELAIQQAVATRDSFNIIDERSFLKIDVFVPASGPLGEGQLARRRTYSLSDTGPTVFVLGPEDTILQKVRWFELGGRASDRQWRDILGVVRLAGELDLDYVREVASSGGLADSIERALAEGGR